MFTNRQLLIIQVLIKENYFMTGKEIASRLNLSLKTIQKEIKYIKSRLKDYQIYVISQKGKGYMLKMESKLQSEIFLNSISYFSKTAIQENYDREFILLTIIQKTIIEKETVNIAYFEERMFVGKKYVRSELDKVKQLAARYHLKLHLRQGKGIYLKGALLQIQMLYMDLLEKVDNRFLYGEQFFNWRDDREMHLLTQYFWDHKIMIPYVKVRKLCLFLFIQHSFANYAAEAPQGELNPFEAKLSASDLNTIAKDICLFFDVTPTPSFTLTLAKMLLCFLEKEQLQRYSTVIQEIQYIDRQKMLALIRNSLQSGTNIFRISIEELSVIVGDLLLVNLIEQEMCLTSAFGNIKNLGGKTMLCEYIGADILDTFKNRFGVDYSIDVLATIKLVLRSHTIKFSEVSSKMIYVISKQDYSVGDYIAKNLEHEFSQLVGGIEALSTLDETILPTDLIVTDIPIENFISYQNVLYFTSLSNYQEVKNSVQNYVSLSSEKSRNFFEKLDLNTLEADCGQTTYLSALQQLPVLRPAQEQIQQLDRIQERYHIFVRNRIAIIFLVDPQKDIKVSPVWHPHAYSWHGQKIHLTLIVQLNQLSDFIFFDAPIAKLLDDPEMERYIKSSQNSSEDFEEKLLEIIY